MSYLPEDVDLIRLLLRTKRRGELVGPAELTAITGWRAHEVDAFLRSSHSAGLVTSGPEGTIRAVHDGQEVSRPSPKRSKHSQFALHRLKAGDVVTGSWSTYTLLTHCGRGGVGTVWLASTETGRRVALKFFDPRTDIVARTSPEDVRARFLKEGRYGLKIRHNQLISIIDVVDDIDTPFICMEAAEHTAEVVVRSAQRGNQHVATTLDLISAVASALAYLHRQGCIHRDVKPANILWIGNRWVLGDLGIVKWSDVNPLFTIPGAQTSDRAHVGAWQYMAPEQGQPPYRAVPASDIYALGITWFELCEGYRPCPQAVGAGRLNFRAGSAQVERLIQAMTQYDAHLRPSIDTILTSLKSFKSVPGPIYTLRHSKSANGK